MWNTPISIQVALGIVLWSSKAIVCRGGSRGRVQGVRTPPEITCGFLIQLVFCKKKKTIWFIGVEVGQETCAPPPKKNLGSAPGLVVTQAQHFTVFCVSVTKSQSNFY